MAHILLGHTKHGKSTLTNYLCGRKIVCTGGSSRRDFDLKVSDGSGLLIGNDRISLTAQPESITDLETLFFYWDSPGFYDTRGLRQEIMNGFYIQKLF